MVAFAACRRVASWSAWKILITASSRCRPRTNNASARPSRTDPSTRALWCGSLHQNLESATRSPSSTPSTPTSCASSLDERGRVSRGVTDDEDVDEKPAASSISMLRAAGSFVMSPSNPPPAPTEVAEELASFAFGGAGLNFDEAMSSDMQDEPFYRDAFYRSPSRLEEALSAPLPPSPPIYGFAAATAALEPR